MPTLFDVPLKTLAGEETTLETFRGHVLLIVNTASGCGLTPQLAGLESLYLRYKHCGFDVLGFPANDFAGQEPLSNEAIGSFCTSKYNVTFPMFEKTTVTGPETNDLYKMLKNAQPVATVADPGFRANLDGFLTQNGEKTNASPELLWNFEKFLVNRKGQVVARFAPDTLPTADVIVKAVEKELPPLEGASPAHAA